MGHRYNVGSSPLYIPLFPVGVGEVERWKNLSIRSAILHPHSVVSFGVDLVSSVPSSVRLSLVILLSRPRVPRSLALVLIVPITSIVLLHVYWLRCAGRAPLTCWFVFSSSLMPFPFF